jgi:transposase
VRPSTRALHLRENVEPEMRKLFGKGVTRLTSELRHLLDHCEAMVIYQQAMDEELKRVALGNEVCRRFMDIPGIGPICALNFYAIVGEPERFRRSADIGAYFGLTPSVRQSGLTTRTGRISRMGSTVMRGLLVQASITFMRSSSADSQLGDWAARIAQRRGKGRARVALARKLATVMLAMWKTGESYQPRLGLVAT